MSSQPLLVIFDDQIARQWEPLALTRPVGELLLGCLTQRARAERVLKLPLHGYLGCPELEGFEEPGAGPVLTEPPPRSAARLFLCSRVVPSWNARLSYPANPAAVVVDGQVVGWYAPPDSPEPPPGFWQFPHADLAPREQLVLEGRVLRAVWELIDRNPAQLVEDFGAMGTGGPERPVNAPFSALGSPTGWLRVGANVTIEPGVVIDFTSGPIWLDDGAVVRAFTRLAGPAYVGPGSIVLGGSVGSVSIGPHCRVRGEVEESVLLGYSNKAHDGFLGHSYLGRWVNLGALTVTSDLKNNYGTVRMWTPSGVVDTGLIKLGCLLGDHVKTGIGTPISTGTVVGAGSNLFGAELPPTFVPPFSWGSGDELTGYDVDRFLETATVVMARRDLIMSAASQRQLRHAWVRGRAMAGS